MYKKELLEKTLELSLLEKHIIKLKKEIENYIEIYIGENENLEYYHCKYHLGNIAHNYSILNDLEIKRDRLKVEVCTLYKCSK